MLCAKSCALALDGVDDGERCQSLDTWRGDASLAIIHSHVRNYMRELDFVNGWSHTCGDTRVGMFVSTVALHVWEKAMLDSTSCDLCI